MAHGADIYGDFGSVPDVASQGGGGTPFGVRASPADFGAQVGAGVEKIGATGEQLAAHYEDMATTTAANDTLVNGYVPKVNALISDYKKLSGNEAVQQLPVYQKQLQEINEKYQSTGSLKQQELMGQFITKHSIYTMSDMSNHADREYTQHENIVSKQALQSTMDDAANNWQNPQAVEFNVNQAKKLSEFNNSQKIGFDDESQKVVKQLAKEDASKVVSNTINMALDNGNYELANLYKNHYGDILSGRDKLQIEKSVSSLNISSNAKSYVDNLLTGSPAVQPGSDHYDAIHTKATIADLAHKNDFDPNIAFALHGAESDYGRGIKDDSRLKDDFQTDPKYRDKGFEGDDLESSVHNSAKIWNQNNTDLTTRIGRAPSLSEGYLAYNQGGAGAAALLTASPSDTAVAALSKIMPPAQAQEHVLKNGGSVTMSAADFSRQIEDRFQTHYDTQKVNVTEPSAILAQTKIQLPAMQPASNPHELFSQMSERFPAAQAAVDAIPDDKIREAASKELKLKYEQAKLGDTAWKNTQAQVAQQYGQDPRYTSMDQIPQTVKSNLSAAGQLKAVETMLTDKLNPKKDNTYGAGFLSTLDRLATDDPTDRISDLSSLQQLYGERQDLHSSGFKQLQGLLKISDTPEGKARITQQSQYLNDLRLKMVAGEADSEGKKNFEKALPLFFSGYNNAINNKEDISDFISFDKKSSKSFVKQLGLPTKAEMTSKKIQNSLTTISGLQSALTVPRPD